MNQSAHTEVAIVGGGLWGLAAAHFLRRLAPESEVSVFEAAPRPGGAVRTLRRGGFLFDAGPSSLLDNSPDLRPLLAATGLTGQLIQAREAAARNRYILRDGALRRVPASPPALLRSDLLSAAAKLRVAREPLVRRAPADAEESLEEFVGRRLGREFVDYGADPFVAGTFAGSPSELCVRSAFPRLWRLEQEHGSLIRGAARVSRRRGEPAGGAGPGGGIASFSGGMQTLVEGLAAPLGERLRTRARLTSVSRGSGGFRLAFEGPGAPACVTARALLLTLPAHAYRELRLDADVPEGLTEIPYPPVTAVFFGYERHPLDPPPEGLGFLVPRVEGRRILGTFWNSSAFAGRAPEGGAAFTTFVGGRRQPEIAAWDDGRLVETVRGELRELMGVEPAPDVVLIHRWKRAIPQYVVGHRALMAGIDRLEAGCPGLFVGGNFRGGISIGDCVTGAAEAARRIAAHL